MAAKKTYLLAGVTRGIGLAIYKQLRQAEPQSHLIVGARDVHADVAKEMSSASNVTVVHIDAADDKSPFEAVKTLEEQGVHVIDVVIANTGHQPPRETLDKININDLRDAITVNSLAPLLLFQATRALLQRSAQPVFTVTSTGRASFGTQHLYAAQNASSYSASKVLANFLVVRMHLESPWLTAYVVYPGFVADSDAAIQALGKEASAAAIESGKAITSQRSAQLMLTLLGQAKRETHSGRFFDIQSGDEIPY